MSQPITILIATHGDRNDLLKRTLNSLEACTLVDEYHELVVIENGQRGAAESIINACDPRLRARYLYTEQANKSYALNVALETITDGLVVMLDDDIRVAPTLIEAYAEHSRQTAQAACFGGPIHIEYEQAPEQWLCKYLPASACGWSLREDETMGDRHFIGMNWAAYRSDLIEAGGFDARKGPGVEIVSIGEETDLQQRLRKRGVRAIYVPEARVWHYVPIDRCSPNWIIERDYRRSVGKAMDAAGRPGRAFVLFLKRIGRRLLAHGLSSLNAYLNGPIIEFHATRNRRIAEGLARPAKVKHHRQCSATQ